MCRRRLFILCLTMLSFYVLTINLYELFRGHSFIISRQIPGKMIRPNHKHYKTEHWHAIEDISSYNWPLHVSKRDSPIGMQWHRFLSPGNTSISDSGIWPSVHANKTNDRIVNQLLFAKHLKSVLSQDEKYKYILVYFSPGMNSGSYVFQECPINKCSISKNVKFLKQMDAVLFQNAVPDPVPKRQSREQIWILYLLEAPLHTQRLDDYNGLINWTATYRHDSTLVTPYEKFVVTNRTANDPATSQNRPKIKKIAWFVSNCYTTNNRMEYVRELQAHITVDIYGECGNLRCPRGQHEDACFGMLKHDYFFYLAFENSNCRDYVTEKLFRNALSNDVVPVVMGASKADYERVSPPNSFIHVDDFRSPRDLAEYLDLLISNRTMYNEYLAWKGSGHYIDTKFWCRLCAMLHGTRNHVTWYDNIEEWWNGPEVCKTSRGTQKWASWRPNTQAKWR